MKKRKTVMVMCALAFLLPAGDSLGVGAKNKRVFSYSVLNEKNRTACITQINADEESLKIPSKIDGYTIVKIGKNNLRTLSEDGADNSKFYETCYKECVMLKSAKQKLKKIIIPDSVKVVGAGAFCGCGKLEQVHLGAKIKYINNMSFYKTGIKKIVIPMAVKQIGESAFDSCTKLRDLIVRSKDVRIGISAFDTSDNYKQDLGSLKKIILPSKFAGRLYPHSLGGYIGERFKWPNFASKWRSIRFFEGAMGVAPKMKTIYFPKGTRRVFIGAGNLSKRSKKKLVIPSSVRKVAIEAQRWTIDKLVIKGRNTKLVGDIAMGLRPNKNYISVKNVVAPKGSPAYVYAKKALYPDTNTGDEDQNWENFDNNNCAYMDNDLKMRRVKVKVLT